MKSVIKLYILLLAFVFSFSGFSKLIGLAEFEASLQTLFVPLWSIPMLVLGIPVVELLLVALFIAKPREGLIGALILLLLFTIVVTFALLQGYDVSCGCFGSYEAVDWLFYLRNLILIAATYFALWWSEKRKLDLSFSPNKD